MGYLPVSDNNIEERLGIAVSMSVSSLKCTIFQSHSAPDNSASEQSLHVALKQVFDDTAALVRQLTRQLKVQLQIRKLVINNINNIIYYMYKVLCLLYKMFIFNMKLLFNLMD